MPVRPRAGLDLILFHAPEGTRTGAGGRRNPGSPASPAGQPGARSQHPGAGAWGHPVPAAGRPRGSLNGSASVCAETFSNKELKYGEKQHVPPPRSPLRPARHSRSSDVTSAAPEPALQPEQHPRGALGARRVRTEDQTCRAQGCHGPCVTDRPREGRGRSPAPQRRDTNEAQTPGRRRGQEDRRPCALLPSRARGRSPCAHGRATGPPAPAPGPRGRRRVRLAMPLGPGTQRPAPRLRASHEGRVDGRGAARPVSALHLP